MGSLSESKPEYGALQKFLPLARISPDSLREISERARVFNVDSGTTLFSAGDKDDWTMFLLEGQVNLTFADDAHETISAASEASRLPLAPQSPRPATARTASAASIFRVSRSLLDMHVDQAAGDSIEVVEVDADSPDLQGRLLEQMFHDYFNQRVEVPVLPDVALRVRELVNDPDAVPNTMADIIAGDPSLTAKLMQIANSPACRGVVEVSGCRDAIARLGMKAASDIVLAMAMANVFETDSALLKTRMQELWRSSARVGAICCVLARETKIVPPDRAMLAGLVHDIGAIAVVAGASRHLEFAAAPGASTAASKAPGAAVEALRGQFGSMVLRAWEFPDDIVACAIETDAWDRTPVHADCCDLVQVSRVLNSLGSAGFASMPNLASLPAFLRLNLGELNSDNTLAVLSEADDTIAELERALTPGS